MQHYQVNAKLDQHQLFQDHPDKDLAKDDCVFCKGKGRVSTNRNLEGQWEKWEIGGDYDGCFTHLDDSESKVKRNIISLLW